MGSPTRAADALRDTARQALDSYAPKPPPEAANLACRAGCSFCCTLRIEVSVPEALAVAEAIRAMPEPERVATAARVRDTDDRTRGMATTERMRARIPCPLLQDNRCSVYESRPLSCRAAVSLNATACERSFAGTPTPIPMPRVYWEALGASINVLGIALAAHGMPLRSHEFNAALRIALDTDDAAARWLTREDIFVPAQSAP